LLGKKKKNNFISTNNEINDEKLKLL